MRLRQRYLSVLLLAGLIASGAPLAWAASHRDAPLIALESVRRIHLTGRLCLGISPEGLNAVVQVLSLL